MTRQHVAAVWRLVSGLAIRLSALYMSVAAFAADMGQPKDSFMLIEQGKVVSSVVVLGGQSGDILDRAADAIDAPIREWVGTGLNRVRVLPTSKDLPGGACVVLGTLKAIREWRPDFEQLYPEALRVNGADEHGFACVPSKNGDASQLVVVGKTPRGVYNGAIWLRDMCIDGRGTAVWLMPAPILRSPQMAMRGVYCLSMYGVVSKYSPEDWRRVFESFARDGMDRVYFWVSGMFPSQKFPWTFDRDASTGTNIRTVAQIREVMQAAHDFGLKFYLGSGVFAWSTAYYLGEGLPNNGTATGAGGLCPAIPEVRQRHKEYFTEMIEALPEADGFFFELRDEHGQCMCEYCNKDIDTFGSKMYGQYEISFIHEFTRDLWQEHPKVNICVNVGYKEHERDVAFYKAISEMRDPRFEFLDVRGSWEFPGPTGERLPGSYFSSKMTHWDPFYSRLLGEIVQVSEKIARSGYAGYSPAFEPGYATADYYCQEIPYPTDVLPYAATGFAFRELTWEPILAASNLEQRAQQRFFGVDASKELAKDLFVLRDWVVTNGKTITKYSQPLVNYIGETLKPPVLAVVAAEQLKKSEFDAQSEQFLAELTQIAGIVNDGLPLLTRIEGNVTKAQSQGTLKTKSTARGMLKLIQDSRENIKQAQFEDERLAGWINQLKEQRGAPKPSAEKPVINAPEALPVGQ
ncbi:MAG: hypothetical protein K1Y02_05100 [Candidatus Hydrogenedentes bacterium]|nr:hypothetical protein [Candidatus Hydrogenedentota bacterium]